MGRNIAHAGECADHEVGPVRADIGHWQGIDVDQTLGTLDLITHEVDERGPACDVARARRGRADRILLGSHLLEAEWKHHQVLPAASATAATIPG
jgi:hypothetical protein